MTPDILRVVRYAILITLVTAGMAVDLHVRQRYPVFESILGGLLIALFVFVAVVQRREWLSEWNDFRGL